MIDWRFDIVVACGSYLSERHMEKKEQMPELGAGGVRGASLSAVRFRGIFGI